MNKLTLMAGAFIVLILGFMTDQKEFEASGLTLLWIALSINN
jgi:hypothetical protein